MVQNSVPVQPAAGEGGIFRCARVAGIELQRRLEFHERLAQAAGAAEGDAELVVKIGVGRGEPHCCRQVFDRLGPATDREKQVAEEIVAAGVVRMPGQQF